ncbi:serine hydrolase [Sphingomonas sp. BIUV-7]|uniref:Serine hydrolase n=1 Tax=Sphingomonas natans TaxID=3063330 RepID=A0ABT8Y923_9SPHN|nr:serine hydrolase [Sphingomonas sp. BIUV-7]MDO6414343.1 serine hydrolase [Sphingomonas sp. BIUV-7]
MRRFMDAFGTPGIGVALVRAGGPALARGYGVRQLGRPEKVDADTLFAIASNSKAFVAAGIAMLVEADKLGWDEPVIRYLTDFATSDPVVTQSMTVRDLLCHRSGLPLGAGDLMQFPLSNHTRADLYHGLRYLPFERGFRSGYAYDNILYVVAGVLIERVSGMTFEDYTTKRLLEPLGMRTAVASRELVRTANLAARHARLGPPTPGVGPLSVVNPDESAAASPAGGIHASVTDISLWLQTQLAKGVTPSGHRLWSEKDADAMWTPQVVTAATEGPTADNPVRGVLQGYGLGWFLSDYRGHRILFHSGGLSGQVTQTALLPEQGIGIAVFTNVEDGLSAPLRNAILDLAVAAPPFDWVAAAERGRARNEAELRKEAGGGDFAVPPGGLSLALGAYPGRYRDPWYGDIVVAEKGGRLSIDFTRTPIFKSRLEPFGPDTFRTRFAKGAGEDAVVAFVIESGKAVRLKLRALSPLADFSYDFQHLAPVRVG